MSNGKQPIVTPCCGAEMIILTRPEGSAYTQRDVPDEIMCDGEGCLNTWSAKGVPDDWNK